MEAAALPQPTEGYASARKKAEGKTQRDAIRCLKRHLTRRVWQLLRAPDRARNDALSLTHS